MNTSKAAVVLHSMIGKIISLVGYILGIIFLPVAIFGLTDIRAKGAVGGVIFSLIFVAFSVWAIIKGSKIKRRIKRYKVYVGLISQENLTSLIGIATRTSQPVDFVRYDIQKMIDKKFFVNACIDKNTNEIIINRPAPSAQSFQTAQPDLVVEMESVQCPGCGAFSAKHKGYSGTCEYCGSLIK